MAKVTSSVKRVEIQGDIVLTLSPIEAIVLRNILGAVVCGSRFDCGYHSGQIFDALDHAGVPQTEDRLTNRIEFSDQAECLLKDALDNWKPKS